MAFSSGLPQPDADSISPKRKLPNDGFPGSELVAAGDADGPSGSSPVPITVWRVTELDGPFDVQGDDALATAVTAMIVGSYGRPGDTIVSLGADPVLAGTAGAAGCDYRAVTTTADLADLDHVAGRTALIVLRWPPAHHDDPISDAALRDLFAACRMLLHRDGATIVALSTDPVIDDYQQHCRTLIPAARHSGLDLIRHIVAVTEPLTEPNDRPRPTSTISPASNLAEDQLAIRQHILMFVIGGGRHG